MEDSLQAVGSMLNSIQESNGSNATAREMILRGEGTKQRKSDWTTSHRGYSQKEIKLAIYFLLMESIVVMLKHRV